jgi:hypothetical protein
MEQSSRVPRAPSDLSDLLHQRLSMYALAASAAGVGVLALAQPAEARIVYKATHVVVGRNGRYKLDLNHDKIADFTLMNTYGCNTDYCYDRLSAMPVEGNGVEGRKGFLSRDEADTVGQLDSLPALGPDPFPCGYLSVIAQTA